MSQKPDREEPQRKVWWLKQWLDRWMHWMEAPVSEGMLEVALAIHAITVATTTFIWERLEQQVAGSINLWFVSGLWFSALWLVSAMAFLVLFFVYLWQKVILPDKSIYESIYLGEFIYLVVSTPYGWLIVVFYLVEITLWAALWLGR